MVDTNPTMKTSSFSIALLLGSAVLLPGSALIAADAASTTPPAPPAPATPAAPAAEVAPAAPLPAPNRVVYAPRLPSAKELTQAAAAQGLAINRIDQTSSEVTVVYQLPDGRTNTVAYRLLAGADSGVATAETAPPPPRRTVIYTPAPPNVIYYEPARRVYDPWYWDPYWDSPVSLNFGFGYVYRGGGFRGDFDDFHHRRDFDHHRRH